MTTNDNATRQPNYPYQINEDKTTPALRCHDAEACALGQRACPSPAACGCAPTAACASIGEQEREKAAEHYGAMALEARTVGLHQIAESSPTAGMNIGQRILHVGGRENAAGYIEFGSVAAVRALVGQLLRDLQAAPPAPAANCGMCGAKNVTPTDIGDCPRCHWDELTHVPAQEHATQLTGQAIPVYELNVRGVFQDCTPTVSAFGLPDGKYPLYLAAAPAQGQEDARDAWLQPKDMEALQRFQETVEDDESHDIGKEAVARLSAFGCLQSHGFGRHGVTAFGDYLLYSWAGARTLPFSTQAERDAVHRAAIEARAAQGGA